MLEALLFYSCLSERVLTIPESLLLLDCKEEITFLAGDCKRVIISPINSFLDLSWANIDKLLGRKLVRVGKSGGSRKKRTRKRTSTKKTKKKRSKRRKSSSRKRRKGSRKKK